MAEFSSSESGFGRFFVSLSVVCDTFLGAILGAVAFFGAVAALLGTALWVAIFALGFYKLI